MPFPASWLEEKISTAAGQNRLGHAYLLTASRMEPLEALFQKLAVRLLQSTRPDHPDLHVIRPESKSRRLTVEQVRDLEKGLRLKAYQAPVKVAAIFAADRMCQGAAEPANAFLKTLEEPPAHSVIFLLTEAPEQLLPTIRSRCLLLPVAEEGPPALPLSPEWILHWLKPSPVRHPGDVAYARASLLSEEWNRRKRELEKESSSRDESGDDDATAAWIESKFLLLRDQILAHLIHSIWNDPVVGLSLEQAAQACEALEELRYALSRNIEQGLSLERCCLKISGII